MELFKLTVENGSGSGDYSPGETVTIKADDADENGHFTLWNVTGGNGVAFADETKAETTFVMPYSDVTVTAVFEAHDYVDGKCSVCGYEDKNYVPSAEDEKDNNKVNAGGNGSKNDSVSNDTKVTAEKTASSVDTADENNVMLYVMGLIVSIMAAGSLAVYKNKKSIKG